MSQAARPELASAARNILGQTSAVGREASGAIEPALADLFAPTLRDLGSVDNVRDARLVATTLVGVLQRHVWGETQPDDEDLEHLTSFLTAAARRTA
jgi:hypothetical protein